MKDWEWNLLEDKTLVDHVEIGGVEVRAGDRVRLHPRSGGDVLDIALRGQIAIVESIEEDYEGKQHLAVVLEEDPGRDLGLMRQPGHRFFFDPADVEPLPAQEPAAKTTTALQPLILIAGIGNIFLGDDGFGVEVVRRLASRNLTEAVRVADFGIRGLDLVYALEDEYETTILIDAFPHGQAPGTVSVIEPDRKDFAASPGDFSNSFIEPHGMHPMKVLRAASAMHGPLKRVLLVGCEPATLGGEEGHMGLSKPVEAAVEVAVNVVESLAKKILNDITRENTHDNTEGAAQCA